MKFVGLSVALVLAMSASVGACELCAIYNANGASGQFDRGLMLTLEEQFIPYRTSQLNGEEVTLPYSDFLDSSITRLLVGYNFSERFGLSLNMPFIRNDFELTDLRYSPPGVFPFGTSRLVSESGVESGLGDMSLIGRWTIFRQSGMTHGVNVNFLGGIKLPTGDSSRLDDEIEQDRVYINYFLPPGQPHDPLSHSISPIHPHDLALGSGSFDGIFGLTINGRWRRLLFNAELQYYLRTEGEASFRYGDEFQISFGPGAYLLLAPAQTLALRLNATYLSMAEDELLGQESELSGQSDWFLGPQVIFTWGSHFSANTEVDLPLRVANGGLQNAPDYRITGALSWAF